MPWYTLTGDTDMTEDHAAPEPLPAEPLPAERRSERARLNALGEERPRFLLEYPEDPELEDLIRAFELGDFAWVRRHAPDLVRRAADPAVRRAALELRQRIDPEPLLVLLLALACSLFLFVAAWLYTR